MGTPCSKYHADGVETQPVGTVCLPSAGNVAANGAVFKSAGSAEVLPGRLFTSLAELLD
jgi:hypothetical protein